MLNAIVELIDNKELFIWDAVVAWRNHIDRADLYNNTKSNYLTGMLKLIESDIIDVRLKLNNSDKTWEDEAKRKIEGKSEWSAATKTIRRSCLNSLCNFIQTDFDRTVKPYRRHPEPQEIKYILSNVQDVPLTKNISPEALCTAISKINERDAYIVWLMMHTGQPLEKVLDLKKESLRASYMDSEDAIQNGLNPNAKHAHMAYIDFDNKSNYIPGHIVDDINKICKNSKHFLFETVNGKRIVRTQVMRTLKQAGRNMGLDFDLNPKVLHGYACAHIFDKRSELEKAMGFSID